MDKITILIADDHTLIRESWSFILNSDPRFRVISEAGTAEEAIELAQRLRPDVVILDINLPGISGIEAVPLIRKYSPRSRILGVSLHTQPAYARRMMQEGALGYLTKNSSKEEMFTALAEILGGKRYVCQEIRDILSEQMFSGDDPLARFHAMTQRELDIVKLVKDGLSSKEIGDRLFISAKTVEVHRYNILKKLKLPNAAALVNFINNNHIDLGN